MGEEPGRSWPAASGAPVIRAASDPGAIREEIDATRQELGDTIEALAEKTDMRAQAKHELAKMKAYVSEKTDALLGKKDYPLGEAVTSPASTASAANEKAPTRRLQRTWSRSQPSARLRWAGRSGDGVQDAPPSDLPPATRRGLAGTTRLARRSRRCRTGRRVRRQGRCGVARRSSPLLLW